MLRVMRNGTHHIDLDDDDDDAPPARSPQASRVANGRGPRNVDGRTLPARRMKEIVRDLERDVGGKPNTAERAAIDHVASLMFRHEQLKTKLAAGADVDSDELIRIGRAVRIGLQGLGLQDAPANTRRRTRNDDDDGQTDLETYLTSIGKTFDSGGSDHGDVEADPAELAGLPDDDELAEIDRRRPDRDNGRMIRRRPPPVARDDPAPATAAPTTAPTTAPKANGKAKTKGKPVKTRGLLDRVRG